jgi:very-short-patch-repair endonuclease
MADTHADAAVDEYFARQYGIINHAQARKAGLTPRMIERRVESGRWRHLARGLYAVSSAPPTWHQRLAAAVLYHNQAVVTGNSAAKLHGLEVPTVKRPEVMVPFTANARSPLAKVERSRFYFQTHKTRVAGFEVISPAETVLKLAASRGDDEVGRLLDHTLATRTASLDHYQDILDRIAGGRVRGAPALRRAVLERRSDAYQPPTSELERLSRRLTDRPEIPSTRHQHPLLGTAGLMIVDTFIEDWGLILEVDGRNYHTRKADFERDRRRDNAAAAQGLIVLRFTWQMVRNDFDYCLKTLVDTGRQRALRKPS